MDKHKESADDMAYRRACETCDRVLAELDAILEEDNQCTQPDDTQTM